MTCEVWVRPIENGFLATVWGLPDCVVEAPTRDEAIEKARAQVRNLFASGEVVRVEIDLPGEAKARGIGIFADEDEESWNAFLAAMQDYRRDVDTNLDHL
jgi:hypothetical protein